MELNKIFIGIIFGIVMTSGLYIFLADATTQYHTTLPADYNNSFIRIQGVLSDVNRTAASVQTQLLDIPTQAGLADYLGFFFNSGYQALKASAAIFSGMVTIADVSIDTLVPGQMGGVVKLGLLAAIVVLIFIGILMHAVVKSDRL